MPAAVDSESRSTLLEGSTSSNIPPSSSSNNPSTNNAAVQTDSPSPSASHSSSSSPSSASTATTSSDSASTSSNENADPSQLLQDDYGLIDLTGTNTWTLDQFTLENGTVLTQVPVNFKTFGKLNAARDNGLVVCHALTGYSALDGWWNDLLGENKAFDSSRYFIICANLLGSCYGTCGPTTINPHTNRPYQSSFPIVTVRDTVRLHSKLIIEHLGLTRVSVIGGSLGGMQALEWSLLHPPSFIQTIVVLACSAIQSSWQIGLNHIQRTCIMNDPNYANGEYDKNSTPVDGLSAARQLAMITYRTHYVYDRKFRDNYNDNSNNNNRHSDNTSSSTTSAISTSPRSYEVESYLRYQGTKLVNRFDANSYIRLTQMLDSHDVGRDRGGVVEALSSIQQPVLVMGIDSDVLYPITEQEFMAKHIKHSNFVRIHSSEGHDGFLLEQQQIGSEIKRFLDKFGIPPSDQQGAAPSGEGYFRMAVMEF